VDKVILETMFAISTRLLQPVGSFIRNNSSVS